jgi:MFS family permease
MDFMATPRRRRLLFAALYLSEGAPIGFIWLALPTELRAAGVPLERITWLTATLVLPWTFKFVFAPLVDALRTPRFTLRHWILGAQGAMCATLAGVPAIGLDEDIAPLASLLLVHACAAATQDVAVDALCISTTPHEERGRLNGWMQAGMLLGRAAMGGGALVLRGYLGLGGIVALLVTITGFSALMLLSSRLPTHPTPDDALGERARRTSRALRRMLTHRNTWFGLAFAFIGGAGFKALEVVLGPFLIDREYAREEIGWFTAGPMIGATLVGAVLGGALADRLPRRRIVVIALVFIAASVTLLAFADWRMNGARGPHLLGLLSVTALGIGVYIAASHACLMDATDPAVAATQFSAFMGATNGCESWSTYVMGRIAESRGYPLAFVCLSAASLLALPALLRMNRPSPYSTQ